MCIRDSLHGHGALDQFEQLGLAHIVDGRDQVLAAVRQNLRREENLKQLISMANYLGYACVGLVLALVATTTVMSVQDRIKEHAVLQTIGFSGPRVFRLIMAESVLLSIAGGVIGVAAAMLLLKLSSLSVGAEAVTIAFTPSLRLAITGVVVAALAGTLAGIAPAMQAARTEIVSALRQA